MICLLSFIQVCIADNPLKKWLIGSLGLDMTTALVSAEPRLPPNLHSVASEVAANDSIDACLMYKEQLDLVPNFYTYTVKSSLLPIRRVQNALVSLYFHHIHPMFPVVDEYHITELHRRYRGKEELMDPSDFTVYHAIMVAGFAVNIPLFLIT